MEENGRENQAASHPLGGFSIDHEFIIARAKEVILNPKGVWGIIKAEDFSIKQFYLRYLLVLLAVPWVCNYIGMVIFGVPVPFLEHNFRYSIVGGLIFTIFQYGISLVSVLIGGYLLQVIAPQFKGEISLPNAVKVLGYAMTPFCVVGVLMILPVLGLLAGLAGIYGLYLAYQGVSQLSTVPSEKRPLFFGAWFLAFLVTSFILNIILSVFAPSMPQPDLKLGDKLKLPGGVSVDVKEFEKGMKELEKGLKTFTPPATE